MPKENHRFYVRYLVHNIQTFKLLQRQILKVLEARIRELRHGN
jgi:hypothetical protein